MHIPLSYRFALAATGCILACQAAPALAHPGHGFADLITGLTHPLSGFDHLVAMVVVGLFAAKRLDAPAWPLPFTFVAAMAIGSFLGQSQPAPAVEIGIALGLLIAGVALAWAHKLPTGLACAGIAGFGLLHGWAHGAEQAAAGSSGWFIPGALATTALLHGLGIVAGRALHRLPPQAGKVCWQAAGGVTTIAGLAMLAA